MPGKKSTNKKLDEVYKQNPWNSTKKFQAAAEQKGVDKKTANKYLKEKVVHDQKVPKPKFMPIISKKPGGYQMDTFINDPRAGGKNYLMLININSRKGYAYPMNGKGSQAVQSALEQFIRDEPNVTSIESDQDKAYLSNDVLDWIKNHNINYTTTTDDNHNNLGIINRFMRTIRDMASKKGLMDDKLWSHLNKDGYLTNKNYQPTTKIKDADMANLISSYNNSPHRGIDYKIPNRFTAGDEEEYIKKKSLESNPYDFHEGDRVQIVNDNTTFGKKRRQVSYNSYTVEGKKGNLFEVSSKDKSVNEYPGYKLVKSTNAPLAETLKEGKRGDVEKILDYSNNSKKYHVQWWGGTKGYSTQRDLREGNPTKLSRIEREYWIKNIDKIPVEFRKLF